MTSNIDNSISQLASRTPKDLAAYPEEFKKLYENKLWHQLTISLEKFATEPASFPHLPFLYEHLISPLKPYLSPYSFTKLAIKTASQVSHSDAAKLMEQLKESYRPQGDLKAVFALASVECAHYKLLEGDLPSAESTIKESKVTIDRLSNIDPFILGSFHRVSAELGKYKGDFDGYYSATMSYLTLCNESGTDIDLSCDWAHDLIVAALLSKKVYNFGELLFHASFLNSLQQTEFSYLPELVDAFNCGDYSAVEKLSKKVSLHPLLKTQSEFLDKKLKLMALAEGLFNMLKVSRIAPLESVSEICKTPPQSIELLLLEAFALNIIDGKIDQVRSELHIYSVQPRFLNTKQISYLKDSFSTWLSKIQSAITFIEEKAPETVIA